MLTFAGVLSLSIWLYLLLFHGRFWHLSHILVPSPQPGAAAAPVAAVIPARDEAATVGKCVTALLRQTGGDSLRILLVDDASSDGTAEVARAAAAAESKSGYLTVIQGRPLEAGWSGKLWAVEQGIQQARQYDP